MWRRVQLLIARAARFIFAEEEEEYLSEAEVPVSKDKLEQATLEALLQRAFARVPDFPSAIPMYSPEDLKMAWGTQYVRSTHGRRDICLAVDELRSRGFMEDLLSCIGSRLMNEQYPPAELEAVAYVIKWLMSDERRKLLEMYPGLTRRLADLHQSAAGSVFAKRLSDLQRSAA